MGTPSCLSALLCRVRSIPAAYVALLCSAAAVGLCSVYAPIGFRGWDDLHYLQAAQDWIKTGRSLPDNQWAGRLPYVLSLASSIKLFGVSDLALAAPNAVMFLTILISGWLLAKRACGNLAAITTVIVIGSTPFFFRMPTTYYPESMEVGLSAIATLMAFLALWNPDRQCGRAGLLVTAGLVGGIAILVRQTGIVLPVSLAILFFLREYRQPRHALSDVGLLAVGYIIPLVAECAFYYVMTGDPFHRLTVDSQHILIPSDHLVGHVYTGGSPFFNWHLAALWDSPHSYHVHWALNPILNLFSSQEILFAPVLALGSFAFASRFNARVRDIALLTWTVLILQYCLNTFVIVIAPNVRYFGETILLLSVMASIGLVFLTPLPRRMVLAGVLAAALFIATVQSDYVAFSHVVQDFASKKDTPLYVSKAASDRLYLSALEYPRFGASLHIEEPPVGGTRLFIFEDFAQTPESVVMKETCLANAPKWQIIEDDKRPGPYWAWAEFLGVQPKIPASLAVPFRRDYERAVFVERQC